MALAMYGLAQNLGGVIGVTTATRRHNSSSILRRIGFPNVSYGEDYAVALRISRDYEIGRIYESVYLCRRWEGNTDSALPLEFANRYDRYKDWLRTIEIQARTRG